jgi:hypothetical protein
MSGTAGMPGRFRVYYPSGHRFEIEGRIGLYRDKGQFVAPMVLDDDPTKAAMLDPRGVIVRLADRRVVYQPRVMYTQEPDWFLVELKIWMAEHLDWPDRLIPELFPQLAGPNN